MKRLLRQSILCLVFAAVAHGASRPPLDDADLRFWLENMVWHHQFKLQEISAATGLDEDAIKKAQARLGITADAKPKRPIDSPLLVLPYPGGRHPRLGFLDGAIDPRIHADPQIPDCDPGQTQQVHGWLSFYTGDDVRGEFDHIAKVWRPLGTSGGGSR